MITEFIEALIVGAAGDLLYRRFARFPGMPPAVARAAWTLWEAQTK